MILLTALLGCISGEPLPQEYELDRLRILGARSTPAEVRPGEPAMLEALTFAPSGDVGVIWAFCDPFSTETCPSDELVADVASRDLSALSEEEAAQVREELGARGILGVDPWLPAVLFVPEEALADVPDEMLAEGIPFEVDLVAFGPDLEPERAIKRVIISEAATPNNNPAVDRVTVNGDPVEPGAPIVLPAFEEVDLDVLAAEGAVEDYVFVNDDGVEEQRTENLEARWYTTSGTLEAEFDLGELRGTTRAKLVPEADARLIVVVTDGRGGMAWTEHPLVIE